MEHYVLYYTAEEINKLLLALKTLPYIEVVSILNKLDKEIRRNDFEWQVKQTCDPMFPMVTPSVIEASCLSL